MAFRSLAKLLPTRLLALCLLVGAEVVQAQPPAVDGVHIFLSPTWTFELAEPIWVIVYFDGEVTVSGQPQLALTIGAQTRPAPFVGMALTSRPAMLFRYTVAPSDLDTNGIDINADALTRNGGTIQSPDGTNALLDLGSHAISNAPLRTVDGRIETAPAVYAVHVSPPSSGGTFGRGDVISVWVWFSRAVEATGTPRLALMIGAETRYASYAETTAVMPLPVASSPALSPRPARFRYTVQESDRDGDGISVGAGALTLNGGTLRIRGGTTNAVLDLPSHHTISNSARLKVDGERQDSGQTGRRTVSNSAPRLVARLPDLELGVGETLAVDVAAAFIDGDEDPLRYAVSVSEDGFFSATIADGTVQVRGLRPGEATVSVTAEDPFRQTVTTTFQVAVGVRLSVRAVYAVAREGGTVVFAVELSEPLPAPTVARWRLAADEDAATADAEDADLTEAAGEVSIPARATTTTFEVAIADDDDIEPAREHFVVRLEQPDDADVGLVQNASAKAVIQEGVCDRTPAVRDALMRHWQSCHRPKPSDLAALSSLELRGHDIDALRPNDLLGLHGLGHLDLSENALETLPAGLFAGLQRLREVSVEGNPGAPFALTVELARLDAEPWERGPAQLVARTAWAAPFGLAAELSATPADITDLPTTVRIAVGETAGQPFSAASNNGAALTLRADAAPLPTARCGDQPCFRGFRTAPGPALTLFRPPPRALAMPKPEPLQGGEALRLPLASLVQAEEPLEELRWAASSSDNALATARIVDGSLEVTPEPASDGTAEIVLVVTDTHGLSTTLRFQVRVEFHWPRGPTRGWRSILGSEPTEPQ